MNCTFAFCLLNSMSYLTTLRQTLNLFLSNPTWDILSLLFFFSAVFLYGLMAGRNRIIVLLLASYPAALVSQYIPFSENLNSLQTLYIKSFVFFVLVIFIFWILNSSGLARKEINKRRGQMIFLSFLNVGLWASTMFAYVPALKEPLIKLAPLTQLLFGSDTAHFVWLVLPIIVLFFLRRG